MTLLKQLKAWEACEEGYLWTKGQKIKTLPELWVKLQRPDWMLWIAEKQGLALDESKLRMFACDCAEQALPFFEKEYPADKRPRQAIEVARRFAEGKATQAELADARAAVSDAAWNAVSDAARAAAWNAARAAAWDAARDAASDAARDAAWAAAWNAVSDAARDAARAAARDAARDAAWDAAWDAARDAAWDAAWACQADKLRIYFPNLFEE